MSLEKLSDFEEIKPFKNAKKYANSAECPEIAKGHILAALKHASRYRAAMLEAQLELKRMKDYQVDNLTTPLNGLISIHQDS